MTMPGVTVPDVLTIADGVTMSSQEFFELVNERAEEISDFEVGTRCLRVAAYTLSDDLNDYRVPADSQVLGITQDAGHKPRLWVMSTERDHAQKMMLANQEVWQELTEQAEHMEDNMRVLFPKESVSE